jgi:hypothetical protein
MTLRGEAERDQEIETISPDQEVERRSHTNIIEAVGIDISTRSIEGLLEHPIQEILEILARKNQYLKRRRSWTLLRSKRKCFSNRLSKLVSSFMH